MLRATATVLAAALLLAFALPAAPARAQTRTFCSEPVTPFCTNRSTVFDDDSAAERCRLEVEKYTEQMKAFVDCLDTVQDEARERAAEIEERFACMARGGTDCS